MKGCGAEGSVVAVNQFDAGETLSTRARKSALFLSRRLWGEWKMTNDE